MASLAQINIKFSADLRQFSSEMQTVARDLKRTGEQMQQIGGAMAVGFTLPILAAGAASVKMASDYEESMNKVNVAFGSSNESVKEFAKNSLETFGIAEGTALDMAALFGDMATSMGLPQQEAANLSTSLVGLAGDLASFKNIGIEQATTALNGVFTGETESLKLLGIVMTEANLAQFALTQGITKSIKEMTQAEKVQLRYAFVMSKTTNAQGDFERTGGGAANQMRVFQERLKELGNQFGQIILPAFTRLITSLNGAFKSFSTLSEGTKTTIVVVAGLVAAIGPLLGVIGTVLTLVPSMIAGFAGVKVAIASLTATIAANPIGLLAVGLAAVVGYLVLTKKSLQDTVQSINASTEATIKQNKASADLGNEVQRLVNRYDELKAKSKLSKEEQQELSEVIIKIGKVVPGAVTEVNKYGEALDINSKKARAFTDSQKELIALRTKKQIEDNIILLKRLQTEQRGLTISEDDLNSKYVEGIGYVRKRNGVLEKYNKILSTSRALTLEELIIFKEKVVANEQNISTTQKNIQALKGENVQQKVNTESTKELTAAVVDLNDKKEKSFKQGTIAFYENEISKLKELQNEVATTATKYALIQNEINKLQKNIDTLSTPLLEVPSIATTEIDIKFSEGGLSLLENANAAIEEFTTNYEANKQRILDANQAIVDQAVMVGMAVGDAFSSLSESYVNSLGLAETGLEGFAKVMLQTVTKLLAMALSNAIANAIVGATQSGNATGPGAVFATPAFIATAVAGILGAFAAIPKFETGGVVSGSSYYGDKILARVNSGELILNNKQQQALYGMLDSNSTMVNIAMEDIVIDGSKIRIILDRADSKNNRRK
jgi:hypothetical protein